MTDITESRISLVPRSRANRLIAELIKDAEASGNPERYWTDILALVGSSMAAHVSHDAAIRAQAGVIEVARIHRDQLQATNH
ncbi:hypothetical protein [Salinisphaera orenii]|uniref:Uncharacterized protein n=1 Tax=Salinisphaera orenii YIM 95161 TaxID=1051139 RepID=A0A423PRM6_9GAMM|nr:hypothetical protein [Salinisphaera halophila]ROO28269.1 hypothetical protein SAHL_10710 [Salinisphaera halophila YIM 95161]